MTVNEAIEALASAYSDISAALPDALSAEREVIYYDKNLNEVTPEDEAARSVSLDLFISTAEPGENADKLTVASLLLGIRGGVIIDEDADGRICEFKESVQHFLDEIAAAESPVELIENAISMAKEARAKFEEDLERTVRRVRLFSFAAIFAVAAAVITTAILLAVK